MDTTDLESRPATTPRLIARSSILKPIFGKKLLQLEDFALQQQGFLHVIPMATLTGYNLTNLCKYQYNYIKQNFNMKIIR